MSIRMNYRHRELPPAQVLLAAARRIYEYNDVGGGLVWRAFANPAHPGRAKIGGPAGGSDGHGYLMCMLLGHKFKVHQIVWLLHHGAMASHPLDHKDLDRTNNRIENLRACTDSQNSQNSIGMTRPTAGYRKDPKGNGYRAEIQINSKKKFLGYFLDPKDARAAYVAARREQSGEFSPV